MIDLASYTVAGLEAMPTPALVYYADIIEENTRKAIARAGGPQRMWPHVKSHKMRDVVRMQQRMGITRFKCATLAEARMVADCGVEHVLVAYPQIGPNIARYLQLAQAYPATRFYTIGDDAVQLTHLAAAAQAVGKPARVLLDINMGMNRTGIGLDRAGGLYRACAALDGLEMVGLHCYDGHVHDGSLAERVAAAHDAAQAAYALRDGLVAEGIACPLLVMGGTPTFPVHAQTEGVYLSPGTAFIGDGMCMEGVLELEIVPAAGLWTRVISHPAPGQFTLDLGIKGIPADQPVRGLLLGCEGARPLFQSEEHWAWQVAQGAPAPAIGTLLMVIPMHVCPTTAMYPYAWVVQGGALAGRWMVTARDRDV